ncbi:sugar ABC transporter substrate-binding protein [Microlunatus soli]|uniref:ABC-type sugar transport system, substrate-binding protein, contains N-terminal xre family HTH domain n=1 Tax=Microlunatus soli TaxID=630515 RepID=A0A1H1YZM4_9ACTN|nr:substrate-binding domain-containing protein [Microlunatus soli]SDT26934.1 ABC-type sugar transport system, substrate-binding protein, contains N-terminal xre family HTH domain [Microlunatus soli]
MFRPNRWIALALAGLCLVVAGCSLNGPISSPSSAPPPAAESGKVTAPRSGGKLKVGIASREITNDYNRDIIAGAAAVFKKHGASVVTTNGGGDETTHENNIRNLINSGVDAIFIQLGDPESLAPIVQQAERRGITVVTAGIGSAIKGAVTDVGGDEMLMAEMVARALLGAMDYQGDLYAFWVPGAPLLETRLRVLKAVVADYPQVRLHLEPTDHSPAKVQSQMQAVLTAHPKQGSISGVWGAYDQMTSGAVQAIQQANRPEIKVASIDGDRTTFSMLYARNSPFVATVVQNAQRIGSLGATAALDARRGEKPPKATFTTAWVATRNNGIAAAEERYGPSIWKRIRLDPDDIRRRWPQDQQVVVQQPVVPSDEGR